MGKNVRSSHQNNIKQRSKETLRLTTDTISYQKSLQKTANQKQMETTRKTQNKIQQLVETPQFAKHSPVNPKETDDDSEETQCNIKFLRNCPNNDKVMLENNDQQKGLNNNQEPTITIDLENFLRRNVEMLARPDTFWKFIEKELQVINTQYQQMKQQRDALQIELEQTDKSFQTVIDEMKLDNSTQAIIETLKEGMKSLRKEIITTTAPDTQQKKTYAEAANQEPKRQPQSTLVISKKPGIVSQNVIKEKLKKIKCPENIKISKVRYARDTLEIRCCSEKGKEELKNILQQPVNLGEIAEIKDKRPQKQFIIFFNLPEGYSDDGVLEILQTFTNNTQEKKLLKVIKIISSRREGYEHWVVEAPRRAAQNILNQGSLYFGFKKCYARRYFKLRRCTKCQSLRHMTEQCEYRIYCAYCSGQHSQEECNAQYPHCINCKMSNHHQETIFNTDHPSYAGSCPTYQKYLTDFLEKQKQDYQEK